MKHLVRMQISPKTTAIDWSTVVCEGGISPIKFWAKADAIAYTKEYSLEYNLIDRVRIVGDTYWVIFNKDGFLNSENKYSGCTDRRSCWRTTTIYRSGGMISNYYWSEEEATAAIPDKHQEASSITVYCRDGYRRAYREFDK